MRIGAVYSHLNGEEWLLVHRPEVWAEVRATIEAVDASICRTKISNEKTMRGRVLYSPKDINSAFAQRLKPLGWGEERTGYYVTSDMVLVRHTMAMCAEEQRAEYESAGETPIYSYNQTDFVKDRVAIEVQFGKYTFIPFDLFVKHLAFYIGDKIDVGIEIVPMKSLQAQMSSGPGYYEGALYDIARQGRGMPPVPLVLVGIEP